MGLMMSRRRAQQAKKKKIAEKTQAVPVAVQPEIPQDPQEDQSVQDDLPSLEEETPVVEDKKSPPPKHGRSTRR